MSSELRIKLIAQMNLHGLAPNTHRSYVTSAKGLAAYYKESAEKLTDEQIRGYFRYFLEERKLTWGSCHRHLTGLLFFIGMFASGKLKTALAFHLAVERKNFLLC